MIKDMGLRGNLTTKLNEITFIKLIGTKTNL